MRRTNRILYNLIFAKNSPIRKMQANNSIKNSYLNCAISGSFNKYFYEINEYYDDLKKSKFNVLSPINMDICNDSTEFIRLKGDIGSTIGEIEFNHLNAIRNSDFLLVVNPKNYIGISTALEIGFAIANHKPIYFSNKTPEFLVSEHENFYHVKSLDHYIKEVFNYLEFTLLYSYFVKKKQKIIVIDNSEKPINVKLAFKIGIMLAQNYTIFCKNRPQDILLENLLYWPCEIPNLLKILRKTKSIYDRELITKYLCEFIKPITNH